MAQIFKSKELTFSIPEKEAEFTQAPQRTGFTPTITTDYAYMHFTTTIWTFPTRIYSLACPCTISFASMDCPIDISIIESVETLNVLMKTLKSSLNDVEGRLAELSKTKK